MGNTSTMPNTAHRQVADRYDLGDRLGKGGMGTVWRATDTVLKREVAIKEVKLPSVLSGGDLDSLKNRVMREAQTAARLSHPCAVTVFDVVQEDGHTFIVMELVDSPSLEELVQREGPLSPERAARIGLDVLSALETAHNQGITHRDVKPANVMIAADDRAKLADFGIASVKGDPKLTATGLILGSPSYMAPEQASKDTSGPESDLWALGGTLYFAVEGEPPFDRGQAIPTLTAVVYEDPRPMQRAGALAPVITALLAKAPEERPDAKRLRHLLEGAISPAAPTAASATAVATPTAATVAEDPVPGPPRTAAYQDAGPIRPAPVVLNEPARRSRAWLAGVGALAALALVAAFLIPKLDDGGAPAEGSQTRDDRAAAAQQDKEGNAAGDQGAGQDDDAAVAEPGEPADPADTGGEIPAGFNTYNDSTVGYTISYPGDWDAVPIDTRTDFREGTGRYLRIDYTQTPGPDALAQIEDALEPGFIGRHPSYERVQLTPTEFAGTDNAALWEYTYEGQRAYNLQFVTADGEYGFALNFQTPENQWEASQDLWETFKATFVLPGE